MVKSIRLSQFNGFVVCMLATAHVFAQQEEKRDPFDFSIGVRVEATDNRDSGEFKEEDNVDLFVYPEIAFYATSDQSSLDVFYRPSFRYRSDPSPLQNEDEIFHDFTLHADHEATPNTKLRLRNVFTYTDDPSISEGTAIRRNASYIRNVVDAGVLHAFSPLTKADLSGLYGVKRYDDNEVAQESDEDESRVTLLGSHQVSRTALARAQGMYRQYEQDSDLGINRDFDVARVAGGVEKVFSPEFVAVVDVGAEFVEYDDATLNSETFPYVGIDGQYAPIPRFRFTGILDHGVRNSDVFPFVSQEFTEFKLEVEHDASATVTLGLRGTARRSKYDLESRPLSAPAPAPGLAADGDEDTLVLDADVTVAVSDTARIKVLYRLEDIDSEVAPSFTKNTVGASFNVDI
jgi:hypothetical protein